jgi:predicted Zn-dependent peptidase
MKKILFSALLISYGFLQAQVDRSIMPKPTEAKKINISESQVFTTVNGITVILSENHKLPRVAFQFIIGSDPRIEGDKAGLSDFMGSLIMSGTEKRTKDQLDNEIDFIGASLFASKSNVYLGCLTKHIDKGLDLMSDLMQNANFPQSEFERVKKQLQSNLLTTKSDAGSMAKNAVSKLNFPKHPYGEIMTENTLNNITQEDIVASYKNIFKPNGGYLVVVGDINRKELEDLIAKYFLSWRTNGPIFTNPANDGVFPTGNRVVFIKKPGAVQSVVSITYPVKIRTGEQDQLPLKVLNGIFGGGGFGTRLMQNLREDKAYTYGCYSSLEITEFGSWMSAGGNFRNAVTDSAITEILKEFQLIKTDLVKVEELNLTKSSMAGDFARSLESPQTVAEFAYSIIKDKLSKDYYQTYLQRLELITKEDVLAMSQKYFTSTNCNIVVVGNEEIIESLKKFDSDGKIEFLDAFAEEVKDIKLATISKDELIEKYLFAVSLTSSTKELSKKVKKVKSYERVIDMSSPQIPFPLKMTEYFVSPTTEAQKMEGQGIVSYYDGSTGFKLDMQGGKKDMTPDELASKKKSSGLFPEMNYKTNGTNYELTGIENDNGNDYYVLKLIDGENVSYDYYNTTTYLKEKSISIQKVGEETNESTTTYNDYKNVSGILFPHSLTISVGPMNLIGKVSKMELNGKIDLKSLIE